MPRVMNELKGIWGNFLKRSGLPIEVLILKLLEERQVELIEDRALMADIMMEWVMKLGKMWLQVTLVHGTEVWELWEEEFSPGGIGQGGCTGKWGRKASPKGGGPWGQHWSWELQTVWGQG